MELFTYALPESIKFIFILPILLFLWYLIYGLKILFIMNSMLKIQGNIIDISREYVDKRAYILPHYYVKYSYIYKGELYFSNKANYDDVMRPFNILQGRTFISDEQYLELKETFGNKKAVNVWVSDKMPYVSLLYINKGNLLFALTIALIVNIAISGWLIL